MAIKLQLSQIPVSANGRNHCSPPKVSFVVEIGPNTVFQFGLLDGYEPLTNAAQVNGKIVVIDRGICRFTVKVINAQNAAAIVVLIVDNVAGGPPAI